MHIDLVAASSRPGASLVEVVDQRDCWLDLSDPVARRRAQNRLSQRTRRRKKNPDKWTPIRSKIQDISQGHQTVPFCTPALRLRNDDCARGAETIHPRVKYEVVRTIATYFPLTPDYLIPLIHFNVFRAILTNMVSLSITEALSCDEDLDTWFSISATPLPNTVPPSLEPTVVQKTVPHSAYLDGFPLAGLRDALILADGKYDDCELCVDVLGSICQPLFEPAKSPEDAEQSRKGLVVWGEPWRVESWEVEEGFVEKWGWMLKDAKSLLQSTNRWREMRDEEPLDWTKWGLSVD